MSETHGAEKGVCDGCRKRPCVCETVVLPSAENDPRRRYERPPTEGPCVSSPDGWCYVCSTGDGPVYHRECLCVHPDLEDCQLCNGTGVIPPGRGDE